MSMGVAGLCQICERAVAAGSCDRCGAVVCTAHYDEERGVCAGCASERGTGGVPGGRRL